MEIKNKFGEVVRVGTILKSDKFFHDNDAKEVTCIKINSLTIYLQGSPDEVPIILKAKELAESEWRVQGHKS